MRSPFDCWPQIAARLRDAGSIALFLDFDGTLAAIRARPEDVWLGRSTRSLIARLARHRRLRVWVVSGRKLADLRTRTGVSRVRYLGLHGAEGRPRAPLPPETQGTLERAKRALSHQVGQLPGIRIEDKGATFAVHYRAASDVELSLARDSMRAVMTCLNGDFRVLQGRKVWEILPRALGHKGSAVRRELGRLQGGTLPIYIGDDGTDEPAFAALQDGLTIRVGPRSLSRAKYQLRDPKQVRSFLQRLEVELK
jgi:trehalose 6-phosphate phosphatase